MKKHNNSFLIFAILVSFLFFGCKESSDKLADIFSPHELSTIEALIEYYDDFVLSQTPPKQTIGQSYHHFLEQNVPLYESNDNINPFLPPNSDLISFFETLDKGVLSEIFNIGDTIRIWEGGSELKMIFRPWSLTLNLNGKYTALLERLSNENEFIKEYFDAIKQAGDIAPTNYTMIYKNHRVLDLNRKDNRLVLIVNMLITGETVLIED